MKQKLQNKQFSLVLSGGGALGFYYLGVFKFLEENNLYPKEIIGTSIGAVLGSLWSLGFSSQEIEEMALDVLNTSKSSQTFSKEFKRVLLKKYSDSSKTHTIPFSAIVLDYYTLEPVRFNFPSENYLLKDVILAATALPGKYDPVIIRDKKYIDAYSITNFPIEFAKEDIILGIDVLSSCFLSEFKESSSILMKKNKNAFALYSRSLFTLIQQDSKRKAQERNCIYLCPQESTTNLFKYSKIEKKINQGYVDCKSLFNH